VDAEDRKYIYQTFKHLKEKFKSKIFKTLCDNNGGFMTSLIVAYVLFAVAYFILLYLAYDLIKENKRLKERIKEEMKDNIQLNREAKWKQELYEFESKL
jgi:cell division protein FtsL